MKRFLIVVSLLTALLAACGSVPTRGGNMPLPPTITPTTHSRQTATPTPPGTWTMQIEGTIHDRATTDPISGASVRYEVIQSFFPEIQEGWSNATISNERGLFNLPMIVHDTDNIYLIVEAPGYITYEEKLDLFGSRSFAIELILE